MKNLVKKMGRVLLMNIGEILVSVSGYTGKIAAGCLFTAQWRLSIPEWFDGRLTLLYPRRWANDLTHVICANILEVLPIDGNILDLCSGDAFLPFYVYSKRAKHVTCVDYNVEAAKSARRSHMNPRIDYINASVFDFDAPDESFDVVVIRGAIEHFSQQDQQRLFKFAQRVMKTGGYFCGDTPANVSPDSHKLLESHEYEWRDEIQMREELSKVFSTVETKVYVNREPVDRSSFRTSLIWRCRK